MRVGWVAAALMLPLITLPRSMLVQAAAMTVLGAALAAILTPALRALSEATDRLGGDYGVAYAAYNATYAVGLMIGASVGGRLVGMLGTPRALGVAMVAMLALGLAPAMSLTRSPWRW
jgi:predicted MFS family arabinose efflux permease